MSVYSAECLEVRDALEAAQKLVDEMLAEETTYNDGLQDPPKQYIDVMRKEYRSRYPETPAVRREIFHTYLTKAALLGAGFSNPEDAPEGLLEKIKVNQDCLSDDTIDVLMKKPESLPDGVIGFGIGAELLAPETYVELFAHQFEVIGKLSLMEFETGEA